jgi:hypothetical protein
VLGLLEADWLDRLTAFKWAERKSAIAKRERQKHVRGNPHTGYALW